MTAWDDSEDEMRVPWLDRDSADRLVMGRVDPEDAPPGYQEVAQLVRAVDAPASARELRREEEATSSAAALRNALTPVPVPATRRRSTARSRYFRVRVAGLVVIGTLLGTTGLAAAGVLPGPAQNVVSGALAGIGITVPSADHPAATGSEISQLATTTTATGVAKGTAISDEASGGMSQAGERGSASQASASPSEVPPVATPNEGGTGTADAASGGASQLGTTTAD